MRLKHFWLYTPESEPTAWTRKSLIAAGTYARKWKRLMDKNAAAEYGGAAAANRAERERRQKGAQSAAAPPTAAALSPRAAEIVRKANMCA